MIWSMKFCHSKLFAICVAALCLSVGFQTASSWLPVFSACQIEYRSHNPVQDTLQCRVYAAHGNFFIPGNLVNCPTIPPPGNNAQFCSGTTNPGLHMINQMYVQFMKPQAQNGKKHVPIAIVHGCCLSTKSWQTTPDGRMGWDEYFVRQGFDTYMIDQVGRARSGFDASSIQLGAVRPYDCLRFLPDYRCMPTKPQHPDRQLTSSPGTSSVGESLLARLRHAPPQTLLIRVFGSR